MTIAAGTKLGRYEIRSKIGAGGMGQMVERFKMKGYPQCNRIETDDALVFCRVDGTRNRIQH